VLVWGGGGGGGVGVLGERGESSHEKRERQFFQLGGVYIKSFPRGESLNYIFSRKGRGKGGLSSEGGPIFHLLGFFFLEEGGILGGDATSAVQQPEEKKKNSLQPEKNPFPYIALRKAAKSIRLKKRKKRKGT